MTINDRIYGQIKVQDRVIVDLINSRPMQRLKGISQDGASHFIQPHRNVTRFEHSIGVWYLTRRYNRPTEEQIAALLHDTPHTAFSHVVDILMEDEKHEFHDQFTHKVILDSEIPTILARHNIDLERVLRKENYHLLENELPDISVDRWDYFMRDGHMFGLLPQATVSLFLNSIQEKDQQFYFENLRVAGMFAVLFMNFSRLIWLDPSSHGSYYLLVQILQLGLDEGIITEEDLFTTDDEVMQKLKNAQLSKIDGLLSRLSPGKDFEYVSTDETDRADFYGPNKPRYVDPLVKHGGKLQRVSDLIPGMTEYFEEFTNRYKKIGVRRVGE